MTEAEENAVRRTYEVVADSYADHYRTTDPEQPVDIAMITHFLGLVGAGGAVLDAGCGAGRMLPRLAASGCVVEGVDLSEAMVRRARADHGTFATQVASLRDLPHEDGSFDGVFSWYSTIHSDDQDVAVILRELARVLRPAGHLLIAFQTGAGVRDVGPAFRAVGHDVRLLRYHRTAAQVRAALQRAGFTVVAAFDRAPVGAEPDGQAVLIARREAGAADSAPDLT